MKLDRRAALAAGGAAGLGALALWWTGRKTTLAGTGNHAVQLSEAAWRERLTAEQFHVLRESGTEPARSSPLDAEKRAGVYLCAGCAQPLFDAATKFDSGTGWPSFTAPLPGAVGERPDDTLFSRRTEVHCRRCGGHLGHVFDDGPPPTGLRYCMNGAALRFSAA